MTRRTARPFAWLVAAATLLVACATPPRGAPAPTPAALGTSVAAGGATDRERPGPSRGLRADAPRTSPTPVLGPQFTDRSPYVVAGVLIGAGLLIGGVIALAASSVDWDLGFRGGGIGGAAP